MWHARERDALRRAALSVGLRYSRHFEKGCGAPLMGAGSGGTGLMVLSRFPIAESFFWVSAILFYFVKSFAGWLVESFCYLPKYVFYLFLCRCFCGSEPHVAVVRGERGGGGGHVSLLALVFWLLTRYPFQRGVPVASCGRKGTFRMESLWLFTGQTSSRGSGRVRVIRSDPT